MARKITRKTKPQIRWDAHTGGIVPSFKLPQEALAQLHEISSDERLPSLLESNCGNFFLEESIEASKPTAGDYDKTLADLENVTSAFLDRINKLRGHELEGMIDSAWYEATKALPDYDCLQGKAASFLQQIRVAQQYAPVATGRTRSADALRTLIENCKYSLYTCGFSENETEKNLRKVVRICLNSMGKSHLVERIRHYC